MILSRPKSLTCTSSFDSITFIMKCHQYYQIIAKYQYEYPENQLLYTLSSRQPTPAAPIPMNLLCSSLIVRAMIKHTITRVHYFLALHEQKNRLLFINIEGLFYLFFHFIYVIARRHEQPELIKFYILDLTSLFTFLFKGIDM